MVRKARKKRSAAAIVVACAVGALTSAFTDAAGDTALPRGLGLPALIDPANNPSTPDKIGLGRELFFDKRLSGDGKISCATCHDPAQSLRVFLISRESECVGHFDAAMSGAVCISHVFIPVDGALVKFPAIFGLLACSP